MYTIGTMENCPFYRHIVVADPRYGMTTEQIHALALKLYKPFERVALPPRISKRTVYRAPDQDMEQFGVQCRAVHGCLRMLTCELPFEEKVTLSDSGKCLDQEQRTH